MARRKTRSKPLRGVKISGDWWDKHEGREDGKVCKITGNGGRSTRGGTVRIDDVEQCAKICKSHWFDKDTLAFFKSKVGERAYLDGKGGAYFTSSERGPHGPRAYSVRHYNPARCGISTVGKFQGYATQDQATIAAQKKSVFGPSALGKRRRRARR